MTTVLPHDPAIKLPAAGGPSRSGLSGPRPCPDQCPQPGHTAALVVLIHRGARWRRRLRRQRLATDHSRYDAPGYKILSWDWALLADGTVWYRISANWDYQRRECMPVPLVWQQRARITAAGWNALASGGTTPAGLLAQALALAGHYRPGEQPGPT
jgi:hypothetical protein